MFCALCYGNFSLLRGQCCGERVFKRAIPSERIRVLVCDPRSNQVVTRDS
jgi:hypothetical protein